MNDLPRLRMVRALRGEDVDELRGALKWAVAELQAYSLRITRVNEITLTVSRSLSLSAILDVVWAQARWVVDYEHFEMALCLGGRWTRLLPGGDLPGSPLEGHPLFDGITQGRPGAHRQVELCGVAFGSVLLVPLVNENEAMGALIFARAQADAYSGDDLRIASMLGLQLAAVIRNAERYDALQVLTARLDELNRRRRELLHNMLPDEVADELLRAGAVEPVSFECATVMFIDFVGFTSSAAELAPKALLARLDDLFTTFDAIIARHGLEKLKTIGDAYMCVGGVPVPYAGHTRAALSAAQEILDHIDALRRRGEPVWPVRIGVHAGPLIAGIIGTHKYAYDVWGDTVNLAARLEAAGEPGRINVSAEVRYLAEGDVGFTSRGRRPVKGLGEVEMFFVDPRALSPPSLSRRQTLSLGVTPRGLDPIAGKRLTVLIIDDDPEDVRLARRALRGAGVVVRDRPDLEDLPAHAEGADAVVLDLKLARSIGLDTVTRARALLGSTPIVVLTGMDDDAMGVAAMYRGADDYLKKGARDLARLEPTVRRAVARAAYVRGQIG